MMATSNMRLLLTNNLLDERATINNHMVNTKNANWLSNNVEKPNSLTPTAINNDEIIILANFLSSLSFWFILHTRLTLSSIHLPGDRY